MFESFLATTTSEGLSALGTREQRSYELITETVRERLGDAHAALFGEPVATEHGDSYDWYAPLPGKARRLDQLDEDARDAARRRLDQLRDDIRGLAAQIAATGDANDQRLSEALENALNVPGDDHIYVVQTDDGPQPVLTSWAWTSDARRSERGVLTGIDPRRKAAAATAPTAASAPDPVRARRRPFVWLPWLLGLGWLLLAAMLAWIVLLLIQPCALRGPAWLSFCPAPPALADSGRASTIALQDQVDQLERQLAIADRACQPLPPPPPPPPPEPVVEPAPPPQPPQESAVDRRLRQAGATRGDLNFSLIWNGPDDLDLAVTCPAGGLIWFRRKNACNGRLDVDSNASRVVNGPVENIFYNSPGNGVYRVRVTLYKKRGRTASTPFQLLVRDGERTRTLRGRLSRTGEAWTTTYNYAGR